MSSSNKNIDFKIKALINQYLKYGNEVLDFGVQCFDELLSVLYPQIKGLPGLEGETLCFAIQWFFEEKIKDSDALKQNQANDLIEYVGKILKRNICQHTIIFPLQKSILNKDIKFGDTLFLKANSEERILKKISKYSKIDESIVRDLLEHTKNSRSEDFLKFNLLLYKVKDNTQVIKYNSGNMYNIIVNILNIMYRSELFAKDSRDDIFLRAEMWEKPNRHVVVLSQDWNRCGHSYTFEPPICDSNIRFLSKQKAQELFLKLLDLLIYDSEDELITKFKRAFNVYMEAHRQYREKRKYDIALILYITCLESLVAENENEKRIRFSLLVSALIPSIKNKKEVALRLSNLYKNRNNYVHASKSAFLEYRDEELEFIDNISAKFLLLLVDIDSMLIGYKKNNNTKSLDAWKKLLNTKYNEVLFNF